MINMPWLKSKRFLLAVMIITASFFLVHAIIDSRRNLFIGDWYGATEHLHLSVMDKTFTGRRDGDDTSLVYSKYEIDSPHEISLLAPNGVPFMRLTMRDNSDTIESQSIVQPQGGVFILKRIK